MATSELICLSSEDDDSEHSKANGKPKVSAKKKRVSPFIVGPLVKRRNLISTATTEEEDVIISETPISQPPYLSPNTQNKPLLVVKEKLPVHATNGGQDVFSMFLGQCLLRDRSPDMKKIVEKLKRKYEQLDPNYAHSVEFADLLNEKRNCLMAEEGQVYRHITEINIEMKRRKKGKNVVATQSCSTLKENDKNGECEGENGDEEDSEAMRKLNRKVKAIENAMLKVEKRIKKYEESEVDLDDEDNSTFLITDRFKRRMVELYAKWCELTGNLKDAGRTFLRPIHLKLTGIVTVDQTINSFINSSLAKKTRPSKTKPSTPNTLVFPDYEDILKLLHTHNVAQNLGMDVKAEKATAKAAFIKLGEHLKSMRQRDFYDTYATLYEQADDPAKSHTGLMEKLRENRDLGEKKLNAIFDEYSKKQEMAKSLGIADDPHMISDKENDENDDEEELDEEEMEEDDDEKLENDSDPISLHDSDVTICDSNESSDDDAIIIDQHDEKGDRELSLSENKSKVLDSTKAEDISIASLNIDLPAPENNTFSKVTHPNDDKVKDDHENSSSVSPTTTKNITNIIQATIDGVDIEPLDIQDSTTDINEQICADEKPMLKLRSFAKPPGFWQNSQNNQEEGSDGKLATPVNSEPEIIELDTTDEQTSRNKIVNNTKDMNMTMKRSTTVPRKITSVPLTSTNKDVKIFRRLVTIPASKLTPIAKSNLDASKFPSVGQNVFIYSDTKGAQSQPARLVPLSAIEIRNQKSQRPVAHIVGQRKTTAVPQVKPKQETITSINSEVTQSLCINPIAKGAQVSTKIRGKQSTTASLVKSIPINAPDETVSLPAVKTLPKKVINPLVKHQQNIENVMTTSRVTEYKNNVTSAVGQLDFEKR